MLLAEALKRSYGEASVEATEGAVRRQELLVGEKEGRRFVTTPAVLSEEQRMLDYARDGRGACEPLAPGSHPFCRESLNDEQREAVKHILESRDRVVLVRGGAGTGKTTMMAEAVMAIQASGKKVFAFAPSADASRGVLREAGFEDADTVARLLKDEKLQASARGNVIWIDEASLMGSRTMRDVFDLCDRLHARLLLTGDTHQNQSVERGSALRLLETEAGLVPAEVKSIQRQKGDYREAVKSLAAGNIANGFEQLDRLGWIEELPESERHQALARAYAESVSKKKSVLVVSPTHHEGRLVTSAIRHRLKEDKQLGSTDREFLVLHNANLTTAQRADAASYDPEDRLVFHQNAVGFEKGQTLIAGDRPLPLKEAERFTVFRPSKLLLTDRDVVRITRNGTTKDGRHRLNNGALHKIGGFSKSGDILLANGWTVDKDFGHLAHGYCLTSQASQGKTVDRVLISSSSGGFAAASREGFYVAASRGREMARIYTDDREALLEAVHRTEDRISATEFVGPGRSHDARRLQRHRQLVHGPAVRGPEKEAVIYDR
jgi:RecA/RadA recombinase